MNTQQMDRMRNGQGFVAALDQSGGSTPRALEGYGIGPERYSTEEEMFDLVHAMRTRVITSPAFDSRHILASILFERTMDSQIEGRPSADYLWEVKGIVPFLKVDKGLADEENGVRVMKPMPGLDELLARAVQANIFGTKMRSVILRADPEGVRTIVDQQFEVAQRILDAGLVPIIEPEVDIHAPDKAEAEQLLLKDLTGHIDALPEGREVMLKLTIPTVDGLYSGLIASFSRALLAGLRDDQTKEEFDSTLAASIAEIYAASIT